MSRTLGLLLLVTGSLLACKAAEEKVLPPRAVLVSQRGEDGLSGLDYIVTVHCTVRNDGGHGSVSVSAEVVGASKKTQVVPLAAGQQQEVSFVFPEAKLFGKSDKYRCMVE